MRRQVEQHFRVIYRDHRIAFEKYVTEGEPRHWHEDYEIEFVADGEGKSRYIEGDLDLKRGVMFVSRKSDAHSIEAVTPLTIYRFRLPKQCMPEAFWYSMLKQKRILATALNEEMTDHIENMLKLLHSRPEAVSVEERYMQDCLINVIIMLFTKEVNDNPGGNHITEHHKVNQVVLYLKDSFRERHTLKSVADVFGLNPNYLNRILKQHLGTSVINLLKVIRLEYAAYLCGNTDMTTAEICKNCGYSNESNFVRDFRHSFQMPPQRFREYEKKRLAGEEVNPNDYIEKQP